MVVPIMAIISNSDDVIDSRDIIERIRDLEEIRDDDDGGFDEDEQRELDDLESLAEEASASPDWEYGETLIRDSYFETYAQELAEEMDVISGNETWPLNCIDWKLAARELKYDYTSVYFSGVRYWIRE
jgi:hypothetical protein